VFNAVVIILTMQAKEANLRDTPHMQRHTMNILEHTAIVVKFLWPIFI